MDKSNVSLPIDRNTKLIDSQPNEELDTLITLASKKSRLSLVLWLLNVPFMISHMVVAKAAYVLTLEIIPLDRYSPLPEDTLWN
jgi:hypothetical protein